MESPSAEDILLRSIEEKKTRMLTLMASMQEALGELQVLCSSVSRVNISSTDDITSGIYKDLDRKDDAKRYIDVKNNETVQADEYFLSQLRALEARLVSIQGEKSSTEHTTETHKPPDITDAPPGTGPWPLPPNDYKRYGRQLIMPEIGLQGQLRLKASSVLVVGVGGLGCPAAAYLAGAGIGKIGLVDGDVVETSNLHRQILHNTTRVGHLKVDSAVEYLHALNPSISYTRHPEHLTPTTALTLLSPYDLVLDCTDHPTSRYLISDACVLLGKPLVSASALRTDGQLMALNHPARPPGDSTGGPCYRCVFPRPPPADAVVSCGEGGILGPVVGVMGVLQALQAIRMLVSGNVSLSNFPVANRPDAAGAVSPPPSPTLLLFSALAPQQFRSVRLRSRRPDCAACSAQAKVKKESLSSGSLDYVAFCGVTRPVQVLAPEERMEVGELRDRIYAQTADSERNEEERSPTPTLVDVRERVHFELCSLPGSVNVPWSEMVEWKTSADAAGMLGHQEGRHPIHVVCRLGNDSQLAVRKMKELGLDADGSRFIGDVKGGLRAWRNEVDSSWPDF